MKSLKLRDGFYWTGIIDDQLRVFDIIMYTEFGTTYNSYVMKTGDKTVLFETAKAKFFDDYLEKLQEVIDVTKIDYLVMSHTEPDHAGSVEKLLEYSPQMKIVSTACANGFLKEIVNGDFTGIIVKDKQRMTIGDRTLSFMLVPNLHWPDTMYTFIEEEQILVTCDSFGSHYCLPEVLSTEIKNEDDYQRALKYYYDCIIGPFKPFMLKALDRVEKMDIGMVCTGHGPVLVGDRIKEVMAQYRQWSTVVNPNPRKTVIIPYVSAYGYTASLAEKIAEGVKDSGDVDVRSYDMVTADEAQVQTELLFADGILLGTPTIVGEALEPIWKLTLSMFAGTHGGKYAAAFGSYGWSGEGVPHITERLKQLRMKVQDGFRVRFKPSEADLVGAYEYGYSFGCLVQNKEVTKPKKKGARTLVKCLVCGEIFDSSLEVCPVCGVGKEQFVPYEADESGYTNDTKNYYVILGNGSAGFNAAKAIRERDKTGSIVIVSNEEYSTYNRPMLTKAIVAGLDADQIAVTEKSWYAENSVFELLGKTVTGVDTEKREVQLSDSSKLYYTKLILALGSECFIPPMSGSTLPEVVAIRRLSDVKKVEEIMKTGKNAVVIGGGVLGLEAAWELKKGGMNVTVLEMAPALMSRQLDAGASELIKEISKKNGVEIYTGVSVTGITEKTGEDGEPHAAGVSLSDGTVFPADLVIVSAGVRANVAIAKEIGCTVERAIVVNEKMETGLPDIYGCGDCVQYNGVNFALWSEAAEQGRVAGANAAGDDVEYKQVSAALSFHGMNTTLYALGDNGKNANLKYKTLEFRDEGKGQYKKYCFLNNRLCGVTLIGDTGDTAKVTEAFENHVSYTKFLGYL